jgi:hypothetical protein
MTLVVKCRAATHTHTFSNKHYAREQAKDMSHTRVSSLTSVLKDVSGIASIKILHADLLDFLSGQRKHFSSVKFAYRSR